MFGKKSTTQEVRRSPLSPDQASTELKLGQTVRDRVTGLQGIAIAKVELLSGSIQFHVQPQGDGKTIPEGWYVDWQSLEVVDAGISAELPKPAKSPFSLGQEVRDTITGFEGVVVQTLTYTNGCVSHSVQPKTSKKVKEGEFPDAVGFDWKRLEAKSPPKPATKTTSTGGPSMRASSMRHA